jgi:PncC family amidohydrolase
MLSIKKLIYKSMYMDENNDIIGQHSELKLGATTYAKQLLELAKTHELNIVTAESLTAGLIVSTLVDIPGYGSYVYGGFIVYDSDAKRKFIDVVTPSVYSSKCAEEMAVGALNNSRALLAIAVTGHAGPANEQDLGQVDIGVAIRLGVNNIHFSTKRISACDKITRMCDKYHREVSIDFGKCDNAPYGYKCSDKETLFLLRSLIRLYVVQEAFKLAISVIEHKNDVLANNKNELKLNQENYDGKYDGCGEPSRIIKKNIKPIPDNKVNKSCIKENSQAHKVRIQDTLSHTLNDEDAFNSSSSKYSVNGGYDKKYKEYKQKYLSAKKK